MCSRLLLGSPPITYNNATHMPTDSPPGKPFFLLFLELHSKELHCLVNYYKCFISVQRFENLHWSWFSALRICPCFIQMVFLFNLTQLHCELRNSISYFFKNTLQLLTILKLHIVTVTAYFLWKSVSPASLNVKTIQWSAHLLSSSLQWLWYLVFNYNLLSWSLSELFHTNPLLLPRIPVHL